MILIVEDQPMNLKLVETILSANKLKFLSAESGEDAVAMAHTCRVDLILMDLQMPGIDGFEAMQQIRKVAGYETLPIIAVSGNTTDTDMARAEAAGFDGFLKKPFKIDELLNIIEDYLPQSK